MNAAAAVAVCINIHAVLRCDDYCYLHPRNIATRGAHQAPNEIFITASEYDR